jgi:hypothetical protein
MSLAARPAIPQENEMTERPYVTGLFHDRDAAERAFQAMAARGYAREEVSVVTADSIAAPALAPVLRPETEMTSKAAEGAGIGGAIGGVVGALLAAVATVGTSIAVPGLGLVIAGPLAAALAGAGAGAAAGGLLGTLVGLGIPEERVRRYADGIHDGGVVLGVRPHNDEDAQHFEQAWRRGDRSDLLH